MKGYIGYWKTGQQFNSMQDTTGTTVGVLSFPLSVCPQQGAAHNQIIGDKYWLSAIHLYGVIYNLNTSGFNLIRIQIVQLRGRYEIDQSTWTQGDYPRVIEGNAVGIAPAIDPVNAMVAFPLPYAKHEAGSFTVLWDRSFPLMKAATTGDTRLVDIWIRKGFKRLRVHNNTNFSFVDNPIVCYVWGSDDLVAAAQPDITGAEFHFACDQFWKDI